MASAKARTLARAIGSRQQRRLRHGFLEPFHDGERLGEHGAVIEHQRRHEALRIDLEIVLGLLLALAQVTERMFHLNAFEVERDAHAIGRAASEIADELFTELLQYGTGLPRLGGIAAQDTAEGDEVNCRPINWRTAPCRLSWGMSGSAENQGFAQFDTPVGVPDRFDAKRHRGLAFAGGKLPRSRGRISAKASISRKRSCRRRPRRYRRRAETAARREKSTFDDPPRSHRRARAQSRRLRHRACHPAWRMRSYGDIAKQIGGDPLAQAVATLGRNPVTIIVPSPSRAGGGRQGRRLLGFRQYSHQASCWRSRAYSRASRISSIGCNALQLRGASRMIDAPTGR